MPPSAFVPSCNVIFVSSSAFVTVLCFLAFVAALLAASATSFNCPCVAAYPASPLAFVSTAAASSASHDVLDNPVTVAADALTLTFPAVSPSALMIVVPPAVTLVTFRSLFRPTVYSMPPSAFVPSCNVMFVSSSAFVTVLCFSASPATSFSLLALATSSKTALFPSVSDTVYVFPYALSAIGFLSTVEDNVVLVNFKPL